VVIMLAGLAWIAQSAGDSDLAVLALATAGAVFGFALINWPWGKIFPGRRWGLPVRLCHRLDRRFADRTQRQRFDLGAPDGLRLSPAGSVL